jgi:hypothetical protein
MRRKGIVVLANGAPSQAVRELGIRPSKEPDS